MHKYPLRSAFYGSLKKCIHTVGSNPAKSCGMPFVAKQVTANKKPPSHGGGLGLINSGVLQRGFVCRNGINNSDAVGNHGIKICQVKFMIYLRFAAFFTRTFV